MCVARERLAARGRPLGAESAYQPADLLALRRVKQLTAELEFLAELRRELGRVPATEPSESTVIAPGAMVGAEPRLILATPARRAGVR